MTVVFDVVTHAENVPVSSASSVATINNGGVSFNLSVIDKVLESLDVVEETAAR